MRKSFEKHILKIALKLTPIWFKSVKEKLVFRVVGLQKISKGTKKGTEIGTEKERGRNENATCKKERGRNENGIS